MAEFLKALKTTHWLLVLFSVTTLLTSVVPGRFVDYWAALYDIQAIEQLDDMPLTALASAYGEHKIANVDGRVDVHITITPDPKGFGEQLSLMERPKNTLSRILTAANDDEPLNFEDATLSQIRRAFDYPIFIPFPYEERYADLLECSQVLDNGKFIRIEARFDEPAADLPVPGSDELKGSIALDGDTCYEFHYVAYDLRELAWFFLEPPKSDIRKALADRFYIPDPPKSVLELTEQSIWQVVEHRTVANAKLELQRLIQERNQPQSMIGLSVHRETALILAPALMMISLSLMASHALAAREAINTLEPALHYPWIGWYREPASQFITFVSLAVLPTASMAHLYSSASAPWYIHFFVPLVIFATGTLVWLLLRSLQIACGICESDVETTEA